MFQRKKYNNLTKLKLNELMILLEWNTIFKILRFLKN